MVDKKYIVDSDFLLLPSGRSVIVPSYAEILAKYQVYKEKYM